MAVYHGKRVLTLEAEHARSPTEALDRALGEATHVYERLGKTCKLVSCEITASRYTGNAWDITATFEEN